MDGFQLSYTIDAPVDGEGRFVFERVPPGYRGRLYAEVVPRTFTVAVREGMRLISVVKMPAPSTAQKDASRFKANLPEKGSILDSISLLRKHRALHGLPARPCSFTERGGP